MSCNSGIYTVNAGATANAGGAIPLGSIIRRFGCNINLNGNGIIINGAGYYDFDIVLTVLPAAAGAITATLMRDGVAVPGATATATAAAIGDAVTLPITAMVREFGNAPAGTFTVVLSAAATVSNIAVTVDKI